MQRPALFIFLEVLYCLDLELHGTLMFIKIYILNEVYIKSHYWLAFVISRVFTIAGRTARFLLTDQ